MGVSKNAVVGKAHRLNLPSRPSPIRRDGERTPRRRLPRRVQGPTLPVLSAAMSPMPVEPPRPVRRAPGAGIARGVPATARRPRHAVLLADW